MTVQPENALASTEEADLAETVQGRRKLVIVGIALLAILLLLVAGTFAWYMATRKPLSQIPVLSQNTPPHFTSALYSVTQPLGVAIDETTDRVYVTQSGGSTKVVVFDTEGAKVGELTPPGPAGADHVPVYAAVDPSNSDVYVSDRAAGTVYVYDSSGKFLHTLAPEGAKQWAPLGLAFDSTGNLYVTDVSAPTHKILVMKTSGEIVRTMGENDKLSFPNGIAVDPQGRVVVSDSNNGRVLVYGTDGKLIGAFARGDSDAALGLPRGISIDDTGRTYVVDTANHSVQVFAPKDEASPGVPDYSFTFGEEGSTDGTFEYPNGIATDKHGRIYVTDRENNRVQVWSY
jgi:DNA-binding beta-propeller fold protein YncE